ncbi:MAG: 5-methyltetrahydropteroyltriglutamate--homocysteine S-methyltransferase [Alphaproteobacteria bacterium]
MTAPQSPPFHAEHLGSLLRPKELTKAFRARAAGDIDDATFARILEDAIRQVVELQETAGLDIVTDGEFRRASYWGHWVDAIDGLGTAPALFTFHDEGGEEMIFIAATCTGKLSKSKPISTDEFTFLNTVAKTTPKITMPSPSTLHFWRLSQTIAGSGYETDEAYFADLCAIFAKEIADLHALGCRYVQLDEVPLIMLGNPDIRAQVKSLGGDPDRLIDLYITAMNDAAGSRPEGMIAGMHMCRGNFKGRWLTEGGYDDIAEQVFGRVEVDAFFLEYDTERAGGFEPLRFVPKDKKVVLGLVSSKVPQLEDADRLKARIDEAAKYISLDRLSISPQCGFASTVAGNPVSEEDEKKKLELLVTVASDVWGRG